MSQPWDPFLAILRKLWLWKNPDGQLPFDVQRRTVSTLAHLISFSTTGLRAKPTEGWHEMFDEIIPEAAHHLGYKPLDLWYKVVSLWNYSGHALQAHENPEWWVRVPVLGQITEAMKAETEKADD